MPWRMGRAMRRQPLLMSANEGHDRDQLSLLSPSTVEGTSFAILLRAFSSSVQGILEPGSSAPAVGSSAPGRSSLLVQYTEAGGVGASSRVHRRLCADPCRSAASNRRYSLRDRCHVLGVACSCD